MKLRFAGDYCALPQVELPGLVGNQALPDLFLANLETPVVGEPLPPRSPKAGPSLRGTVSGLEPLRGCGAEVCVSLANNHMMDYGPDGLRATLSFCRDLGITAVGAGECIDDAEAPVVLRIGGRRVGVLGRCETQFGIAGPHRPGVAPVGPNLPEAVRALRKCVDVVILSVHAGCEMCSLPSPMWRDLYRECVEAGAHVVHGHHSHVPGAYEMHGAGIIFYSLGNLCVDPSAWSRTYSLPLSSMVADVEVNGTVNLQDVHYLGIRRGPTGEVRVVGEDGGGALRRMEPVALACQVLSDEPLHAAVWQDVAIRLYHGVYAPWLGSMEQCTGVRQRLRLLVSLARRFFRSLLRSKAGAAALDQHVQLLYHLYACESHADAISTALGVLSGELDDLRTVESGQAADELLPWTARGEDWP